MWDHIKEWVWIRDHNLQIHQKVSIANRIILNTYLMGVIEIRNNSDLSFTYIGSKHSLSKSLKKDKKNDDGVVSHQTSEMTAEQGSTNFDVNNSERHKFNCKQDSVSILLRNMRSVHGVTSQNFFYR